MNDSIPPSDERGRTNREREADALLKSAGPEEWEKWPGPWPSREESEFDRIAAAHTGMVPLIAVPLIAALPDFDPEASRHAMRDLMRERPGEEATGVMSQLLDGAMGESAYGSGFTLERRNFPPETCCWGGCNQPLYASEAPRAAGRPRMHCAEHKKDARARTRRLRYRKIHLGKNRNLVYSFQGMDGQDLAGYREVWGRVNTVRV